ncbi:MAG: Hsp20/alpha crystallin family protein [Planctomycetota bacterium]
MSTTQLTRWQPFTSPLLPELSRFMSPDIAEWMREPFRMLGEGEGRPFSPRADLREKNDAYELALEIPGCDSKDIKVAVSGNTLSISGERKREEKKEGETLHVVERYYGAFQRTFTFPSPIDPNTITAETHAGVLTVRIKKDASSVSRKIEVKAK